MYLQIKSEIIVNKIPRNFVIKNINNFKWHRKPAERSRNESLRNRPWPCIRYTKRSQMTRDTGRREWCQRCVQEYRCSAWSYEAIDRWFRGVRWTDGKRTAWSRPGRSPINGGRNANRLLCRVCFMKLQIQCVQSWMS